MISPFLKSLSVRLSILIIDFDIIDFDIIDFDIIDFVPKNQTIERYVRELIPLSIRQITC